MSLKWKGGGSALYIETNGVIEQHSVLWNNANVAPQVLQPKFADIRTEKWDTSGIYIVKSEEQSEDGAFAASRTSDEGN